jgi:hypothetical protein
MKVNRERAWPAIGFPLAVWGVWRLTHLSVVLVAGGSPIDATFEWDGNWYRNLLANWYQRPDPTYETQQNVNFFPTLIWVTLPFRSLLGSTWGAIAVANLTGAAAFASVYIALRSALDERTARLAVVALALWPSSVFLTAYYTEALLITTSAIALWAATTDRHRTGWGAAVVTGMTRSVGFVLGPVIAAVRVIRLRRVDSTAAAYAVAGPLGLGAVCLVQWLAVGDPLAWTRSQAAWGRELSAPWLAGRRLVGGVVGSLPEVVISHLLDLVAFTVVCASLAALTWYWRTRPALWPHLGWGWAAIILPLFTALGSSQSRFILAAWPALAIAGTVDGRAGAILRWAGGAASASFSVWVAIHWTQGTWIA